MHCLSFSITNENDYQFKELGKQSCVSGIEKCAIILAKFLFGLEY